MRLDDLLSFTHVTPFVPFRIQMNSGRTFDIRHPEMIKVGRMTSLIFTDSGAADTVHERFDMVSHVLMESVGAIEAKQSA